MDPFIGEIRMVSFAFAPKGWAFCNGQLLPIAQYTALFSILGTTYGGDGQTTFALPDLQGAAPLHPSDAIGLGTPGGQDGHRLQMAEMPQHTHVLMGSKAEGNASQPGGALALAGAPHGYIEPANLTQMAPQALGTAGSSELHENRQPFLSVNFVIALVGVYPPRS